MSFILEALKKSDNKCQDARVPKLETVHSAALDHHPKRSKWLWLLLPVLLLNAAALLWLLAPRQQQFSDLSTDLQAPATLLAPSTKEVKTEPTTTMVMAPVKNKPQQPSVAVTSEASRPAPSTETIPQPSLLTNVGKEPVFDANLEIKQQKTFVLEALPLSVRREIPEMHMSVHAFYQEDAAANLIRVNDQIMRTGDELNGRYLLDKITAEGAVFRYAGYRFLVPRKNIRN